MAVERPSGVPRSAITSALRRSMPITRWPSPAKRARIARPSPEALPVMAVTRMTAHLRPELVDREEVPHELPYFDHLPVLQTHAQAGWVVERLAVALGMAAEQRDRMRLVGEHVDQLEVKRMRGQRLYVEQERENGVAAAM